MKYSEIRHQYQHKFGLRSIPIDAYSCSISPFFTKFFLRFNILPNDVTILMIVSGIIGAILFAVPVVWVKVTGVVFIHLWYILDCSDGEIARIRKIFSKYGKEIDYMAHTINHPLFILSYIITSFYFGVSHIYIVAGYVLLAWIDSYFRMSYSLSYIETLKCLTNYDSSKNESPDIKQLFSFICCFFTQFPNFALIYPIIMLINIRIANLYLLVEIIVGGLIYIKSVWNWLKKVRRR